MKKITLLFIAFVAFAFSFQAKAQCDYTIVLTDSWGDGWNGVSNLTVSVNGTPVPALTDIGVADPPGNTETFTISGVNDTDEITVAFNPAATATSPDWAQECSYEIFDGNGISVFSSGTSTDPDHNGPLDLDIGSGVIVNCTVCTPPNATIPGTGITADCGGTNTFTFDIEIDDFGGDTGMLEITNTAGVPSTMVDLSAATAPLTVNLTDFPTDTVFDLTLVDNDDPACNFTLANLIFNCPPANNDCIDATPLTVGAVFGDQALNGQTQTAATDSGELPLPTCSTYDPADPTGFGGDVWYSVMVPADGNLDIETNGDPFGDGGDTGMSVYTGSCGGLTEYECDDDDSADGFYSLISIADVALANTTVYIRIFEFGGNAPLSFSISAYSATLSTTNFENENAFTYYPNPVKNTLTLNAQNNIQNVAIYNILGQEVLRTSPNAIDSDVDMSGLAQGAYFVKVTINDVTETVRILKQ